MGKSFRSDSVIAPRINWETGSALFAIFPMKIAGSEMSYRETLYTVFSSKTHPSKVLPSNKETAAGGSAVASETVAAPAPAIAAKYANLLRLMESALSLRGSAPVFFQPTLSQPQIEQVTP